MAPWDEPDKTADAGDGDARTGHVVDGLPPEEQVARMIRILDDDDEYIGGDDNDNDNNNNNNNYDYDEGYDDVPELDDGFEDEREFSTVNATLDDINDALDKLEEQNDQLNEQLRSILAASRRIRSGMDSVNNFGAPGSSNNSL